MPRLTRFQELSGSVEEPASAGTVKARLLTGSARLAETTRIAADACFVTSSWQTLKRKLTTT